MIKSNEKESIEEKIQEIDILRNPFTFKTFDLMKKI